MINALIAEYLQRRHGEDEGWRQGAEDMIIHVVLIQFPQWGWDQGRASEYVADLISDARIAQAG